MITTADQQENQAIDPAKATELVEALLAVVQQFGGGIEDVYKILKDPELAERVGISTMRMDTPSVTYAFDMLPEYKDKDGNTQKYRVLYDTAPSGLGIQDRVIKRLLGDNDPPHVIFEVALQMAEDKNAADLGLTDVKLLLQYQQNNPESEKILRLAKELTGCYLLIPGTVVVGKRGLWHFPCVFSEDGKTLQSSWRWCIYGGIDGYPVIACSE